MSSPPPSSRRRSTRIAAKQQQQVLLQTTPQHLTTTAPSRHRRSGVGSTTVASIAPLIIEDDDDNAVDTATTTSPVSTRWSIWWTRFNTTMVMLATFFAIMYGGHIPCVVMVLILDVLVFKEVLAISRRKPSNNVPEISLLINWILFAVVLYFVVVRAFIFTFADFMMLYLRSISHYHNIISLSLYLGVFCAFVLSLEKGKYKAQFVQFAWSHMILFSVVIQSHFWLDNIFAGLIWIFLPASLVVVNDIWAFIFGFFLGRTPLIQLSPKKTWEGFIGGMAVTVLWGFVVSRYLAHYTWMTCPKKDLLVWNVSCTPDPIFSSATYELPVPLLKMLATIGLGGVRRSVPLYPIQLHALFMAFFSSLIAPYGGFFASGLKRAYKTKDFGDDIPGHGGITDRMDCQFIMGTFSNVYLNSFIMRPDPVDSIFSKIFKLAPESQLDLYARLHSFLLERGLI